MSVIKIDVWENSIKLSIKCCAMDEVMHNARELQDIYSRWARELINVADFA